MSIEEKLSLIDSENAELNKFNSLKEWDDDFFKKVKWDFTYNSNKLEGNTLTYGQTIKLLRELITPQNASLRDVLDMVSHQKILDTVFNNYRSQQISEEKIKALHRELMKSPSQWVEEGLYSPGLYKSFENMTVRASGKIHYYLPPNKVSQAMESLIEKTNQSLESPREHALIIATRFHQQFLNVIHPFSDGNGRIGRILMNLILMKKKYPPVFIKPVDRNSYLSIFELSDNELEPMLDFMADRLLESLEEKKQFLKTL
ncbi:Fic family protein [Pseudoflavitalea rhizosphaerae]|uniref:Fic family protein n=1 Tax=Pseudoflavitalea rhizosphaerae TaxID=1884793 RepID=UPI000F8E94D5|nr:Fic family protein [Pseudoflavitalea rhizosphaerae]